MATGSLGNYSRGCTHVARVSARRAGVYGRRFGVKESGDDGKRVIAARENAG
jgi:hypothetical protein